jgi:5-methylcytosine-specific restriction endonuclease McrA
MLKNNIYNIDREFDYPIVKGIAIRSLEKIVKEKELKHTTNIPHDTIFEDNDYPNNINLHATPASPLLKLKIRNTTKYLNWRLSILKRDNFTCKICHTSVKEKKSLRLEVHHAEAFDDICKENSISGVEQALGCEELWSISNGISLCYTCHKNTESLRTKLRNMFYFAQTRQYR